MAPVTRLRGPEVDGVAERRTTPSGRHSEVGAFGLAVVVIVSLVTAFAELLPVLFRSPFSRWLGQYLSLSIMNIGTGILMLLAAMWVRQRFPAPGRTQYVALFVGVTIAAALAILATFAWESGGTLYTEEEDWSLLGFLAAWGVNVLQVGVFGLAITAAWLYTRAEDDHAAAIARCAVDSARMDEQAAEARLQMLEAQIEPHFLFNTLAHVKRLCETDRDAGERMLDNLMAYLAVALPQMRATDATLGREIDHVRAYLEIQQIRMGRRLAFAIDVDDALRDTRLPPLMVLTLVENAIKHGLTPQVDGGRVDIRASADEGRLRVIVADTGGGFVRSGGGGTGLANIRARLATQFGGAAALSLALNEPTGVVATIELPRSAAGDASR